MSVRQEKSYVKCEGALDNGLLDVGIYLFFTILASHENSMITDDGLKLMTHARFIL